MARDSRGRAAVALLVAGTAVLGPAAALGGYALGQGLRSDEVRTASGRASPAASTPAVPSSTPSAAPTAPTALSPDARRRAERATVRLSPPTESYVGSGSIVSPDGLILTNAHVARPGAPGLAATYGEDSFAEPEPTHLVVSTTDGDGPASAAYRADVLAVDGHLDLAVARISALADGRALPAGTTFPFVEMGSVKGLALGDDLTVYGFPALNGGDLLTVRTGVVSSFLPDRAGRVPGDRYSIETSADFSGGNSGGMALANDGRLIGVPSATLTTEELARAHFVRSVDLAAPLLAAARRGATYRSPNLVASTGREEATDLGWADEYSCEAEGSDSIAPDAESGVARFTLSGATPGEDVLLVLRSDGRLERRTASAYDQTQECVLVSLPYDDEGALVPGPYELEVLVGPDRRSVLLTEVVVSGFDD